MDHAPPAGCVYMWSVESEDGRLWAGPNKKRHRAVNVANKDFPLGTSCYVYRCVVRGGACAEEVSKVREDTPFVTAK
jgi:hypothetical protein